MADYFSAHSGANIDSAVSKVLSISNSSTNIDNAVNKTNAVTYTAAQMNTLLGKVNDLKYTAAQMNTHLDKVNSLKYTADQMNTHLDKVNDWKNQVCNTVYPKNSVYVTATNAAPSLPGTWTLIDKEFTPVKSTLTTGNGISLVNASEITQITYRRMGHQIWLRFEGLTPKTALNDDSNHLLNISRSSLGVTGVYGTYFPVFSDGGQMLVSMSISENSDNTSYLKLTSLDMIQRNNTSNTATSASGLSTFCITLDFLHTEMLDAVCKKWYWQRTA